MSKKLNIGIDADGVIFDLFKYQIENGLKHFKTSEENINIEQYDIQDIFNCTYIDRQKFWIKHIYNYCMHSELMDEAIEVMKKWREEGHKLYNITSRVNVTNNGILGKIFRAMLEKRYEKEGIVFDGVDYCSEKDSASDKMLVCYKRQIDFMLEDKIDNIESISKISNVLCFDTPYNKGIEGENITRVSGFKESYEIVKNYIENLEKEIENKYMLDFKQGTVTFAQITGSPIVPFATNGRIKFRSKDLLVRAGEPMIVRSGEDLDKANEKLEEIVSTMIKENMEDERII